MEELPWDGEAMEAAAEQAKGQGQLSVTFQAVLNNALSRNVSSGAAPDQKVWEEIMGLLTNFSSNITIVKECYPREDHRPHECEPARYCSDGLLDRITTGYLAVHGYVSLAICIFGVVSNLLNVAVLTRKDMAAAPINRILTGLAVADLLVTLEYVPFACHMYVALPARHNYPWAVYMLFHACFTQVLHTISICITLTLAVWRYLAIRYPDRTHALCTQQRSHVAIGASYALALVVCAPNYVASEIQETCAMEVQPPVMGFVLAYKVRPRNEVLNRVNFWVYSVVIKLLPCVILTVITCWLIKALYTVNQRHRALKGYGKCNGDASVAVALTKTSAAGAGGGGGASGGGGGSGGGGSSARSERRTDRTTRMLVAVLILFLVTEFPQGILGLLSGLFGDCFFFKCYQIFGELMDALALLNGAINFILYCSMSRQFRTTFGQLFKPRLLAKWSTPSHTTEVQSTYV